jgi:pyoverdine/dityrosine biosynthesis protein Dit1
MSKISYYYDPQDSLNLVKKPGLVCDMCGMLSKIEPYHKNTMIFMGDDTHYHLDCAIKELKNVTKYKKKLKKLIEEVACQEKT